MFYPKVGHQFSEFFGASDQNVTCFQRPPAETCVQTKLGHKLGGSPSTVWPKHWGVDFMGNSIKKDFNIPGNIHTS